MGFELSQVSSGLETVNEFMERMKSATEEAKSAICKAQKDMTQYYNRRRTLAPMYKPGDRVYLDISDIKNWKHPAAPRHICQTDFDAIFNPRTIASRRSNLGGGVNVRRPLTDNPGAPPIVSQHNFIVQPLVTKE